MTAKLLSHYISEGSVIHINWVWPVFIVSTANLSLYEEIHNFWTAHPPTCHAIMSLEQIRKQVMYMYMSEKFDTLQADVHQLKVRQEELESN